MKARIICKTLDEVRAKMLQLCGAENEETKVYLPVSENGKNDFGVACAVNVNSKDVLALAPYWRTDDNLYELQADLIKSPQLRYFG